VEETVKIKLSPGGVVLPGRCEEIFWGERVHGSTVQRADAVAANNLSSGFTKAGAKPVMILFYPIGNPFSMGNFTTGMGLLQSPGKGPVEAAGADGGGGGWELRGCVRGCDQPQAGSEPVAAHVKKEERNRPAANNVSRLSKRTGRRLTSFSDAFQKWLSHRWLGPGKAMLVRVPNHRKNRSGSGFTRSDRRI
jgi:hypothetical protein